MKRENRENSSFRATDRIVNKETSWGLRKYGKEKFRSSYEHGFAVYLQELGIKYEFEKHGERIENYSGTMLHYIPDFFLPEYRVFIEIVNNLDNRLKNNKYYFQEQHKLKTLIVFDKKSLRDMFDSKFTIFDIIGKKKVNV